MGKTEKTDATPAEEVDKKTHFLHTLYTHTRLVAVFLVAMMYPLLCTIGGPWSIKHYVSITLLNYLEACLLVVLLSLITNRRAYRIASRFVFAIVIIEGVLGLIGAALVHGSLDADVVAAFLATNPAEAREMAGTFLTPKIIGIFLGYPCALLVTYRLCRNATHHAPSKRVRLAMTGLLIVSVCISGYYQYVKAGITHHATPAQMITLVTSCYEYAHCKKHHIIKTHPQLEVTQAGQPPIVVCIIGESTSRLHSSIYGYEKATNPLLQKKVDAGEAVAFRKVKSAWTHTLESFRLMMTTYSKQADKSVRWYECTTLPEIAHEAGYHTYWLSNQSKRGLYDNEISQYAEFCDTSVYVGNKYVGGYRTTFDGELIPILRSMLTKTTGKDFFIVHLMGCHANFANRYPDHFDHFKESDYADKPSSWRENLATYDNAALYNDSVVSALMDLVSDREAIVVYAPDHGLDMYQTRSDHCAHGIGGNAESENVARDIPFVVYMSDLYRTNHPDVAKRIAKSVDKDFDTENLLYLLMDLMQCDFPSHVVAQKSVIR